MLHVVCSLSRHHHHTRQDLPAAIELYEDTIVLRACGQEFKVMVYSNRVFDHLSMQQYALALAESSRNFWGHCLDAKLWQTHHIRYRAWLLTEFLSLAAQVQLLDQVSCYAATVASCKASNVLCPEPAASCNSGCVHDVILCSEVNGHASHSSKLLHAQRMRKDTPLISRVCMVSGSAGFENGILNWRLTSPLRAHAFGAATQKGLVRAQLRAGLA